MLNSETHKGDCDNFSTKVESRTLELRKWYSIPPSTLDHTIIKYKGFIIHLTFYTFLSAGSSTLQAKIKVSFAAFNGYIQRAIVFVIRHS